MQSKRKKWDNKRIKNDRKQKMSRYMSVPRKEAEDGDEKDRELERDLYGTPNTAAHLLNL